MTHADRWDKVSRVYSAALERGPGERLAYVREVCAGDEELRHEVESLLDCHSDAEQFLALPALKWVADQLAEESRAPLSGSARETQPLDPSAADVAPPQTPGDEFFNKRFQMIRRLGAGGMGVVYQVYDQERHEHVALKLLPTLKPAMLSQFKKEFRALAEIIHPNLVPLYELFSDGELWFFTMELVEGVDFLSYVAPSVPSRAEPTTDGGDAAVTSPMTPPRYTDRLRDWGACSSEWEGRLRGAFLQLVGGVSALHAAGSLHCDLKPANVLVRNDSRVIVLDYGLVRHIRANSIQRESIAGTPAYMSPEQAVAGPLTPASDWYAVGVMLHEALTGRCPFIGSVEEILQQKLVVSPAPPSAFGRDVPADLERLCMALLRRDPLARPAETEILASLRPQIVPPASSVELGIAGEATPFVGRANHLARLFTAFEQMAESGPVLVDMHGRSGAGKSTLLVRFLEGAIERRGAVVLAGRCFEQESVPYKAIDSLVDALARYLLGLTDAELFELLPPNVSLLARVFPVLRSLSAVEVATVPPSTTDLTELRKRAFGAFRELLTRIGTRNRLIVAIDDLQWGDVDSAALLTNLLLPPTPPRLLLLFSYRSEYRSTSACLQILENSRQDAHTPWTELDVDPLNLEESRELAHILLQQRAPHAADQRDRIAREAGGNPYFIYELVTHAQTSADWFVRGSSPHLDEVLWRRVQQLPDEPRRLLEIVAVAGQPLGARTAYEAAGVQDIGHSPVVLRSARFIRSSGPGLGDDLEVYHDRIRETITSRLSREVLTQHHGRLATTLEAADGDPETVATHFDRAEQGERAGRHYARAARAAADALAFEGAARLYRRALERAPVGSDYQHELQVQLAHALANAGRGYEAAVAYSVASERANGDDLFELTRRAATQYCISGHIDEGRKLFRDVLGHVGLRPPGGTIRTRVLLLLLRLRLHRTGLAFSERPASHVSAAALRRIDALWSYSAALSTVDVLGVAAIQTQCLLLALRAGEPYRLARSLAWEAVLTSASGWKGASRAALLLERADALAQRVDEPHAHGMVSLASGWTAFLQMRLPEALCHCRRAEEIFRDRCTAAWWELSTTRTMIAWALVHCGNITELARVTPSYVNDARERGDVGTLTNLGAVATPYLRLAADDPDGAREQIDQAAALWRHEGVHIQHVALLFSRLSLALYEEDGETAWRLITDHWRSLRQSMQLYNQVARVVMLDLRARCAISASVIREDPLLLTRAESDERRIRRESAPWTAPFADRILAGLAAARRQRHAAVSCLERATAGFEALQLRVQAAACRHRLGQAIGGDQGQRLIGQAERDMRSEQVRNVRRMSAMYVTGFDD